VTYNSKLAIHFTTLALHINNIQHKHISLAKCGMLLLGMCMALITLSQGTAPTRARADVLQLVTHSQCNSNLW